MFRTFSLKTKPTARFASSLWILLTGFGCSPQMTGSLTPNGFKHSTYAYDVESQPKTSTLLNSDWVLDSAYESRGDLRPKETSSYKTTLSFDLNGDGVFEAKEEAFVYDLRYVHRVHSGVIWLRTVPVSMTLRDKELRVLMQDYVDGIAGSGYELVAVGDETELFEKRYAADVVRQGPGTLGGAKSFAADFGVANLDQLQLDKDARHRQVMVVISRPGFDYEIHGASTKEPAKFPVLFIAGYSSLPADFQRGLTDFESLLSRVRFGGSAGYKVNWEDPSSVAPPENPPTAAPSSPAPDVASASPPS